MSDEDLAAVPYAELWLSELGAVVPEYRRPRGEVRPDLPPAAPRHAHRDDTGRFAPDPARGHPPA